MRKIVKFSIGEYYHVFNRGVDKREIFSDKYDVYRFIQSLEEFNNIEFGNDILFVCRKKNYKHKKCGGRTATNVKAVGRGNKKQKIVNIICFCLNINHFHLILEELVGGGISEFMKRVGGGYSGYYNRKYDRSGSLFQGRFKAVHIKSNEQLLNTSAYVNLNNKIHKKFEKTKNNFIDSIFNRSSWEEYIANNKYKFCKKGIVLSQFNNSREYKRFAEETVKIIKEMRLGD